MFDTASDELLKSLRDTIVNKPPYISGTLPLSPGSFKLYYLNEGIPSYVDFTNATEEQVAALAAACQPATFGVNQMDVLDESYRKAGKMDASHFATPLVPERTELIRFIREELLDGDDSPRPVKIELYKLNVYALSGKDSFFKAHQDTPRGEHMFGSLVLVFPTQHEGGALILRHRGEEWTFDSAQVVKDQPSPTIGFIAFFSDVEHQVSRVTAGYRFTLTYNLYYDDASPTASNSLDASSSGANLASFKTAFSNLLRNREFLPSGGLVGFALEHAYPVEKSLEHVPSILKGSDAMVWRACTDLGIQPKIYLVYGEQHEDAWRVLVDRVCEGHTAFDGGYAEMLTFREGAIPFEIIEEKYFPKWYRERLQPVSWVLAPKATHTKVKTHYATYGNEPSTSYTYGEGCIIVTVPTLEEREERLYMKSDADCRTVS
ncbi:hypothetical protein EWM64_g3206 [Hericium alpestre]|uniref:Fe2OG dioxygenase domain-containing protein n=1 Tax=Hericium alpestre TaxID=135208 RepID=A0A4Z0A548_9AGAM|nr:hypothetical protein EWM64_g3206 [Hericium alpestre]